LVHHQHDLVGVWVVHVHQVLDHLCKIDGGALVANDHLPPTPQRFGQHEHGCHAIALILVVVTGWPAWRHRHRSARLTDELHAGLIQTHLRAPWIIRSGIDLQHILHVVDELAAGRLWQAILLLQPGLEFVFFSVWRTVSCEMASAISSSTTLSANKRSVQRLRPFGAGLQASVTRRASCAPSSWAGVAGARDVDGAPPRSLPPRIVYAPARR